MAVEGEERPRITGHHTPLTQTGAEGEAASALIVIANEPQPQDRKTGRKRSLDDGLTSKGQERVQGDPPERRVRPSKTFKELFLPDKLREIRLPSAQDAARCEDIVMIWAHVTKGVPIKDHLFNYTPALYLGESKLLEGLKGVQTAEQMEEFLRKDCGLTSTRRARPAPKRAKTVPADTPVESPQEQEAAAVAAAKAAAGAGAKEAPESNEGDLEDKDPCQGMFAILIEPHVPLIEALSDGNVEAVRRLVHDQASDIRIMPERRRGNTNGMKVVYMKTTKIFLDCTQELSTAGACYVPPQSVRHLLCTASDNDRVEIIYHLIRSFKSWVLQDWMLLLAELDTSLAYAAEELKASDLTPADLRELRMLSKNLEALKKALSETEKGEVVVPASVADAFLANLTAAATAAAQEEAAVPLTLRDGAAATPQPSPASAAAATVPLTADSPGLPALSATAIETLSNAAKGNNLKSSMVFELLQALRASGMPLPTAPPDRPAIGSLFYFSRKACPGFKHDGYTYDKAEAHAILKVDKVPRMRVYYANIGGDMALQRRSYHALDDPDRVLVHYLRFSPPQRFETAKGGAEAAEEAEGEPEGEAAAADLERGGAAVLEEEMALPEARCDSPLRKAVVVYTPPSARKRRFREESPDAPPIRAVALSARELAALGVCVSRSKIEPSPSVERCCAAVNGVFDDLQAGPELTITALRSAALAAFGVPLAAVSLSHEKNWHMMAENSPQRDSIFPVVADTVERLTAEARVVAALEGVAAGDRMGMARALGVLANATVGAARPLMDLVMYIQSGKAPLEWVVNTFTLIRDAVCRGEMDKAQMWAEISVANKPTDDA